MLQRSHLRLVKDAGCRNTPGLAHWRQDFLAAKKSRSVKTRRMYEIVIDQFVNSVGEQHWPPTRFDVVDFLHHLEQRVSHTTVHTYWRTLRTWFNYIDALDGFGNAPNPAEQIKRLKLAPPNPRKIPKGYATSDIEKFLQYLDGLPKDNPLNVRDATLVHLLYRTGMRSGEAASLQCNDLDLRDYHIALDSENTKTHEDRDVYFGKNIASRLLDWLTVLDGRGYEYPWVFPAGKVWGKSVILLKKPITPHGILETVKRRLDEAGLPPNTVHALRFTFTREAMQAGKPLSSIQRQLGHSSPAMVLYYARAWAIDQKGSFCDWGD